MCRAFWAAAGYAGGLGAGQDAVCGQAGRCFQSGLWFCTHARLLLTDILDCTSNLKGFNTWCYTPIFLVVSGSSYPSICGLGTVAAVVLTYSTLSVQ